MAKQGGCAVLAKRTLHAAIKLIKLGGRARCQVMLIACPRHVRAEAVAERYGFRHRYAVHGRHTRVHPASFPSFTHPFHPRILRHRRISVLCAPGKCDARARGRALGPRRLRACTTVYKSRIRVTSYEKRTHVGPESHAHTFHTQADGSSISRSRRRRASASSPSGHSGRWSSSGGRRSAASH